MKTTTVLIYKTDHEWKPICKYCSPSYGDLLVGMSRHDTCTNMFKTYDNGMFMGKVMRYNDSCRPTQTIPRNNTPDKLYKSPDYITENNNGDVVVSDSHRRAVVVTSRKEIHRFSYKGPLLSRPQLEPSGVCTDVMSHILVCDAITYTVQMLSQDGEFMKYLLTDRLPGIDYYAPYGLSYDFYTHCLCVESESPRDGDDNMLSLYRHIKRHPTILGKPELSHTHVLQKNYS